MCYQKLPISRQQRIPTVCAVMLCGILALVLLGSVPQALDAQAGASLVVRAPEQVAVGEPIEIELYVTRVDDFAGYEAHLLFDTTAAIFSDVQQRQNRLKEQGRDILPLAVAEHDRGASFGFASCPFADCIANEGARQERGGGGDLFLAKVWITPNRTGRLNIQFDAVKFVDTQGNPLNVANATPRIVVQVGEGSNEIAVPGGAWQIGNTAGVRRETPDVTHDRQVTAADVMDVALAWQSTHENGAPCGAVPDTALDLNQDNCIDVADVQIAASGASAAGPAPEGANAPLLFTVNTTSDAGDATPGNGICDTASGCTLRAAITEANAHAGPDTIHFAIPGNGPHTINLTSNLPNISDTTGGTTINGYSEPGASPNTHAQQSNAVIKIQVNGQGPSAFDAIRISSSNNVIRGLAVYNVRRGIYIFGAGANNNVIAGNFIGTNAAATFAQTTSIEDANGVHITNGADNNRIGGAALADRNVISGNSRHGVATFFEGTNSNVVRNNIIGLSPQGDRRLANLGHGIDINSSSAGNIIGGMGANQRNIISGNGEPSTTMYYAGVEISHGSGNRDNKVLGNCFGTDLTCNAAPGYARLSHYGVRLEDLVNNNEVAFNVIGNTQQGGVHIDGFSTVNNVVHDNRIGISANGAAIPNAFFGVRVKFHAKQNTIGPNNIIANNPIGVHIDFDDDDRNTITRNSIYNNSELGIDLGPKAGVTPNDNGDGDAGANQELNYPELTSATTSQVQGSACGEAVVPKPCTVEIFVASSNSSDSGGGQYGQGRTLVGTGTASGAFTIAISGVTNGELLTATATDAEGNTSEFSRNLAVSGGAAQGKWRVISRQNASGGTLHMSKGPKATATFTFEGKTLKWLTRTGPKFGKARIIIDGKKQVVDLYSAEPANDVRIKFKGLGPGPHTVRLIVLGKKNALAGGTKVIVDAFVARGLRLEDTDPAIEYEP